MGAVAIGGNRMNNNYLIGYQLVKLNEGCLIQDLKNNDKYAY